MFSVHFFYVSFKHSAFSIFTRTCIKVWTTCETFFLNKNNCTMNWPRYFKQIFFRIVLFTNVIYASSYLNEKTFVFNIISKYEVVYEWKRINPHFPGTLFFINSTIIWLTHHSCTIYDLMSRSITSASYHILNWAVWLFDELCCLGQLFIVPISHHILHEKLFKDQGFMLKIVIRQWMLWMEILYALN